MSLYVTLLLSPLEQIIGIAFEILDSDASESTTKIEVELSDLRHIPYELEKAFNETRKCLSRDEVIPFENIEDDVHYDGFNNVNELYEVFILQLFEHRCLIMRKKLSTKIFDDAWRFYILLQLIF